MLDNEVREAYRRLHVLMKDYIEGLDPSDAALRYIVECNLIFCYRDNMLAVNIYFGEMGIHRLTQFKTYDIFSLACEIFIISNSKIEKFSR